MGTYLSIKLATKITLHKSDVASNNRTTKEFLQQLNNHESNLTKLFDFAPDIDDERMYAFTLKPAAIQTALLPLLYAFYSDFYGSNTHQDVLEKIKSCSSFEALMQYAANSYTPFQKHSDFERIKLQIAESVKIAAYSEGVMLSVEGKISFESLDYSLQFFEKMMLNNYAQFELGEFLGIGFV